MKETESLQTLELAKRTGSWALVVSLSCVVQQMECEEPQDTRVTCTLLTLAHILILSQKSLPILNSELLYEIVKNFFNIQ